jgi:hypothetical protein
MREIPPPLLKHLPLDAKETVAHWWAGLSDTQQSDLSELYDKRQDTCFFGMIKEELQAPVPKVIGGKFIPTDDAAVWDGWCAEYFDYLMSNPELDSFRGPIVFRPFYIGAGQMAAIARLLRAGNSESSIALSVRSIA